jgi:hypothetical protein
VQLDQQTKGEHMVVDGFCYDLTTAYLPCRYVPMALGQLEALRKAGQYRARLYPVPEELLAPIPPYDTVEQQVRIVPGSYLYGWTISARVTGGGVMYYDTPINILIRMTEGATGIPLMGDFLYATNMGGLVAIPAFTPVGAGVPTLMTEPRLIVEPGWINVEITNNSQVAVPGPPVVFSGIQIVLYCAEPCQVVEDAWQVSECA